MNLFKYFYKTYPLRTFLACVMVTIASIISALTLTALPALLFKVLGRSGSKKAEIFDQAIANIGFEPSTTNLLSILIIGIILQNLLLGGAKIYSGLTKAKIVKDLRVKLLNSMSRSKWSFFTKQAAGKISTSLISEADRAGNGYVACISILASIVQIAAYLTVAFFISWQIAVIAIISSLILLLLFSKLISISKELGKQDTMLLSSFNSRLTDLTKNIKSMKAMSRESHAEAILESSMKKMKNVSKRNTVATESLSSFQEIVLMLTIILTVYYSFTSLDIPIEFVIVLIFLYLRTMKQFGKAQKQLQNLAHCISGYDGIKELIDTANNHVEINEGKKSPTLNQEIKIENVSFKHDQNYILHNASATIHKNKINSIIGRSGAGKTTLIDLICGIYKPEQGQILIDCTPLAEIDLSEWRKKIGYVTQETTLLNTTIRENITLGDTGYDDSDIFAALDRAHCTDFINTCEKGIDTLVGENGSKLSGGQRQRILIARALIHNPSLLILDEATSALDKKTEKNICDIFKELSTEITILSISHRAAITNISDYTIKLEDKILHESNQ